MATATARSNSNSSQLPSFFIFLLFFFLPDFVLFPPLDSPTFWGRVGWLATTVAPGRKEEEEEGGGGIGIFLKRGDARRKIISPSSQVFGCIYFSRLLSFRTVDKIVFLYFCEIKTFVRGMLCGRPAVRGRGASSTRAEPLCVFFFKAGRSQARQRREWEGGALFLGEGGVRIRCICPKSAFHACLCFPPFLFLFPTQEVKESGKLQLNLFLAIHHKRISHNST